MLVIVLSSLFKLFVTQDANKLCNYFLFCVVNYALKIRVISFEIIAMVVVLVIK